jgi:hypothetical protein
MLLQHTHILLPREPAVEVAVVAPPPPPLASPPIRQVFPAQELKLSCSLGRDDTAPKGVARISEFFKRGQQPGLVRGRVKGEGRERERERENRGDVGVAMAEGRKT